MFFFLAGDSTNSRGVAIVIIPNFEYKLLDFVPNKHGRFIFLTIEIESKYTLTLVNIYGGPNIDDPNWYIELFKKAEQYESNLMIFAGDWNTALKEEDLYNYKAQRNI